MPEQRASVSFHGPDEDVQDISDEPTGHLQIEDLGDQGGVLLQNNAVLPFNAASLRNVVLIGKATQIYAQQAVAGGSLLGQPMGAGGGSSDVVPTYTISPLQGLKDVLAAQGNATANVTLITRFHDLAYRDASVEMRVKGTVTADGQTYTFTDEDLSVLWKHTQPCSCSTGT